MFPTWSQFFDQNLPAIIISIVTGIVAVAIGIYIYVRHRRGERPKPRFWMFGLVFVSFSAVLGLVQIRALSNFIEYRFDLSRVSEIRLTCMPSESGGPLPGDIVIASDDKLGSGLPSLLTAQNSSRRHEFFTDGIRLEITSAGEDQIDKRRTMFIYRRSSWRGDVAHLIVPTTDGSFGANWLELSSPAFLHWCDQAIQAAGGF